MLINFSHALALCPERRVKNIPGPFLRLEEPVLRDLKKRDANESAFYNAHLGDVTRSRSAVARI